LPLKIDFLIGSGEGKKLRAIKALFYYPKNAAKNCTEMHNFAQFFDDKNGFQRQNWRGFGGFKSAQKEARLARGRGGEQARALGAGRRGIIAVSRPRSRRVDAPPLWPRTSTGREMTPQRGLQRVW
jgi:tRNA U54 and U55 pseudouridine synthase Pus10